MQASIVPVNEPSITGDAFAPTLPDGRARGVFRVHDDTIELSHANGVVALPRAGLALRVDGNVDRFAHITHPDHPGVALVTPNLTLLEHPLLLADAAFQRQVDREARRARAGVNRFRGAVVATAVAVVATVLIVALLGGRLVGWAIDRVPAELEQRLGTVLFEALVDDESRIDSAETRAALDALLAPLRNGAITSDTRAYPFTVHLIDDPAINAFALPGGTMVLNRGLVLAARDPHELLGVVAHERAHVVARHSLRQLIRSGGLWLALRTLFGDPGGLISVVSEGGATLLGKAYSRDLEREADELGWRLMLGAGLDPNGLTRFLETLYEQERDAAVVPGFLSTHPPTEERMNHLRSLGSSERPPTTQPEVASAFEILQALIQPVEP